MASLDGSASRVNLLLRCQYWARPDVIGPPNESGGGAHYGIAVHSLAEVLSTRQCDDDDWGSAAYTGFLNIVQKEHGLSDIDVIQANLDAQALHGWHAQHIGGEKYHEQKVAFNAHTRTARILTKPEPRDYSECSSEEFPGTADLVAVKPGVVCIVDYKTGHSPWEIYKGQLNFLGMTAAKIYDAQRVVCVVLKVSEGHCYPHHWELGPEELADFENRFVQAWQSIPTAEPVLGDHCTQYYCPLRGTCPATLNAITAETGVSTEDITTDCSITGPEHAAKLYQVKLLMGTARGVLDLQLKKYVDETGGFLLPNGKTYKKSNGAYKECREARVLEGTCNT